MGGKMSRNKGARGEREAAVLLAGWLAPVFDHVGIEQPEIERNLMQSRQGGYDLVGLDWLALEVKRKEAIALDSWWGQTVRQAREGQTPFLMWRPNWSPWRFRTIADVAHFGRTKWSHHPLVVDMDEDAARLWLQYATFRRLVP